MGRRIEKRIDVVGWLLVRVGGSERRNDVLELIGRNDRLDPELGDVLLPLALPDRQTLLSLSVSEGSSVAAVLDRQELAGHGLAARKLDVLEIDRRCVLWTTLD